MIVIGISGKKKSGKSTLAGDILRFASDLWPKYDQEGDRQATDVFKLPFASPIKLICKDLLAISHDMVFGDDDQKNQLTHYRWGDMPHYLQLKATLGSSCPEPSELMRSRDVQQQLGTEMFRYMYPDCFCHFFLTQIRTMAEEGFDGVVLTDDVRFPNELKAIQGTGGYSVRLTRGESLDGHASETSLTDNDSNFDFVLDNRSLSKYMTFGAVVQRLVQEGLVNRIDGDVALLRAEDYYCGH